MAVLSGTQVDSGVTTLARDALIGIADLATRTLGGGKPPDVLLESAPAPVDPLIDLRLPEALRSWLKPSADALGMTIEDVTVRDKYARLNRQFTFLTNGEVRRTLLYIPPKVLNDANTQKYLGMVMWALEKNAYVAVFSEGVETPLSMNALVIDDLWKERLTESRFIAWPYVKELPSLDLLDQIEFMRTRLGLDAVKPFTQGGGAGEVTTGDVVQIAAILSALGFDDARGRRTLLLQAGLSDFASTINLEGAAKKVGIDMIVNLSQYQGGVPAGGQTALGALLRTVMEFPDVPPADAGWLKALITRCRL